jgi:hypothetical protein
VGLETRIAAALTPRGGRAAARAAPAGAARAAELQALATEDLLAEIRRLVSAPSTGGRYDGRAIVDASDHLLTRPLTPSVRADALIQKGIGHRVLREHDVAERAFRDALASAPPCSPEAYQASYQLAWNADYRGDPRAAADAFLELSRTSIEPRQRAWNRLYAAMKLEKAGDAPRALTEYRGLVDEFGASADSDVAGAVRQARSSATRLEGANSGR